MFPIKKWKIEYLPGEGFEFIFEGTREQLSKYMKDNHGCNCSDCKEKEFFDSNQSYEFYIEEIN